MNKIAGALGVFVVLAGFGRVEARTDIVVPGPGLQLSAAQFNVLKRLPAISVCKTKHKRVTCTVENNDGDNSVTMVGAHVGSNLLDIKLFDVARYDQISGLWYEFYVLDNGKVTAAYILGDTNAYQTALTRHTVGMLSAAIKYWGSQEVRR